MARIELSGPTVEQHIADTKALVELAEKGDFERATWMAIGDHLIAIKKLEPTWGNARVAELVGKGETWVKDIVRWRTNPRRGADSPFSDPNNPGKQGLAPARRALTEQPKALIPDIIMALEENPEVAGAVAAALADTPTGSTFRIADQFATLKRVEKKAQDDGVETFRTTWKRGEFYTLINDRCVDIVRYARDIIRKVRKYDGTLNDTKTEQAVMNLEKTEEWVRAAREQLLGISDIDVDALTEDMQRYLDSMGEPK